MLPIPNRIEDESHLDDLLSTPSQGLIELFGRLAGDILVLGVAGKMGVTLARMARRAADAAGPPRRVIGVARFTDPKAKAELLKAGVETIPCDLLNRAEVEALPDAPNVIFMAGKKFGAEGSLEQTWALNVLMPAQVAERYARARIVAFSTGCVYPFVSPLTGGCGEDEPPAPIGEYAQSCLGRERAFGHACLLHGTPVCLIRLNYAIDMRYGVLHDLAAKVWRGDPIELSMGWFNCIWQGDANDWALRALDLCASPAKPLNVTGPEILSVRQVVRRFGELLDRDPIVLGREEETAYLNNSSLAAGLFGYPRIPVERLIEWTADWVSRGGCSLNKPTHYEVRDGKY